MREYGEKAGVLCFRVFLFCFESDGFPQRQTDKDTESVTERERKKEYNV